MRGPRTLRIGAIAVSVMLAGSTIVAAAGGRPSTLGAGQPAQVGAAESCPPADAKPSQTAQIATAKLTSNTTRPTTTSAFTGAPLGPALHRCRPPRPCPQEVGGRRGIHRYQGGDPHEHEGLRVEAGYLDGVCSHPRD